MLQNINIGVVSLGEEQDPWALKGRDWTEPRWFFPPLNIPVFPEKAAELLVKHLPKALCT